MTLYHFKLDLLIWALFDAYLFVDLVALSNGLHGSVQMDWVALNNGMGGLSARRYSSECVEYSLMDLDVEKSRHLFEILDSRESRKSTVIVSQIPVKEWYDLFKDCTYADACLD